MKSYALGEQNTAIFHHFIPDGLKQPTYVQLLYCFHKWQLYVNGNTNAALLFPISLPPKCRHHCNETAYFFFAKRLESNNAIICWHLGFERNGKCVVSFTPFKLMWVTLLNAPYSQFPTSKKNVNNASKGNYAIIVRQNSFCGIYLGACDDEIVFFAFLKIRWGPPSNDVNRLLSSWTSNVSSTTIYDQRHERVCKHTGYWHFSRSFIKKSSSAVSWLLLCFSHS